MVVPEVPLRGEQMPQAMRRAALTRRALAAERCSTPLLSVLDWISFRRHGRASGGVCVGQVPLAPPTVLGIGQISANLQSLHARWVCVVRVVRTVRAGRNSPSRLVLSRC